MRNLILIFVLVLSLVLRLHQLNTVPELNADEAALAYNAYSLLQTGRDEFGDSWPLVFQSFGDFKPGVYVYLAMPFVHFLGAIPLAVRLPSLIFSLVSVWLIYHVSQKIFTTSRHRVAIGLLSSLMLALMPWHIHFSRGAWETQASTAFLLIGSYFFTLIPKRKLFVFPGLIFYFLSLYTYHSMRVIIPLFLIFWAIRFWKVFRKSIAVSFTSLAVCFLFSLPLALQLFSPSGISRAQGVSLLADPGPTWRANELRSYHGLPSSLLVKLAYNRPLLYADRLFDNYISHFSLKFLFYDGETIQRNRVPDFGQLLLISLPFAAAGLWYLVRQVPRRWHLLVFWLLVAPIPSALTFQSPHAVRAFSMTIPLAMIIAYGIVNSVSSIKQSHGRLATSLFISFTIVIFSWDMARYLSNYYFLLPYHFPHATQSGFSQLVPWVEERKSDYEQIFITDRYDQPYILFLFFSQYPPDQFQSQAQLSDRDQFGFSTVRSYDNYRFTSIDFDSLQNFQEKILVIGTEAEIPQNANVVHTITDKYGRIIFKAAQIN